MSHSRMPPIAVVADAHFHDLHAGFGLRPDEADIAVRLLADTVKSTRVFNESSRALTGAIEDIAARCIRHVVLLGDYSDDGQAATLETLGRMLSGYEQRFGMRFYAVAGNHDIFASRGRHRGKRFAGASGGYVLSTSDPAQTDAHARRAAFAPGMYCHGYPAGLQPLRHAGFFRRDGDLHWETPFGRSDSEPSRLYQARSGDGTISCAMMDSSYLVEPFEGLWMLMIDANVFVPLAAADRGAGHDTFADSTDAGWTAMLDQKPFILGWMKDVARRAKQSGKRLIAFSHYPAIDPLRGTGDDLAALIGRTPMIKRIPAASVADAFIDAGVNLHFSGHLHVNDTALHRSDGGFLVNISVPSLVAYPGAYKIVSQSADQVEIETVRIGDWDPDPVLMDSYRSEIAGTGLSAERLMRSRSYREFLHEHIGHLVSRRHLKREWPPRLAALVRTLTLADVAAIALIDLPDAGQDLPDLGDTAMLMALGSALQADATIGGKLPAGICTEDLAAIPLLEFIEDWHRLKMAGGLALGDIPARRQEAYASVLRLFDHAGDGEPKRWREWFKLLFAIYGKYAGLPSEAFSVSLGTGQITAQRQKDAYQA